jgi:hypothetical protein
MMTFHDIPNIWKVIKFHGSKPPTRITRLYPWSRQFSPNTGWKSSRLTSQRAGPSERWRFPRHLVCGRSHAVPPCFGSVIVLSHRQSIAKIGDLEAWSAWSRVPMMFHFPMIKNRRECPKMPKHVPRIRYVKCVPPTSWDKPSKKSQTLDGHHPVVDDHFQFWPWLTQLGQN